jgi:hypothetical protein
MIALPTPTLGSACANAANDQLRTKKKYNRQVAKDAKERRESTWTLGVLGSLLSLLVIL